MNCTSNAEMAAVFLGVMYATARNTARMDQMSNSARYVTVEEICTIHQKMGPNM